jgi:hypothetical protein
MVFDNHTNDNVDRFFDSDKSPMQLKYKSGRGWELNKRVLDETETYTLPNYSKENKQAQSCTLTDFVDIDKNHWQAEKHGDSWKYRSDKGKSFIGEVRLYRNSDIKIFNTSTERTSEWGYAARYSGIPEVYVSFLDSKNFAGTLVKNWSQIDASGDKTITLQEINSAATKLNNASQTQLLSALRENFDEFCNLNKKSLAGDKAIDLMDLAALSFALKPQDNWFNSVINKIAPQEQLDQKIEKDLARTMRDLQKVSRAVTLAELDSIAADTKKEIERRYAVNIKNTNQDSKARNPHYYELVELERALNRSFMHRYINKGKSDLPVIFSKKISDKEQAAYYSHNKEKNTASIVVQNYFFDNNDLTDKNYYKDNSSLSSILIHELAHHSQNKLGWFDSKVAQSYWSRLGWHKANDIRSYFSADIPQLIGKDGTYYEFTGRTTTDHEGKWVKTNQPLSFLSDKLANNIASEEEILKNAQIKPITKYFSTPTEMLAEALTFYRTNADTRTLLLKQSPKLYEFAKAFDQMEINKHYPAFANGNPLMLRCFDGMININCQSIAKEIQDVEKAARGK